MNVNPSEFIHPEDAEALRHLESITGFPTLLKKFMALGYERYAYGQNLAGAIRLSPTQLPTLYNRLPPICDRLGIHVPEFYLQMSPLPNAWTFGDSRIFITVTSSLLELLDDEELNAVIAHECGHILCHHVLYHNLATLLAAGMEALGVLGAVAVPIKLALTYWERRSELSCDRAASIITSPEIVARTMVRLAGGPLALTRDINFEEWAKQADEYESVCQNGAWDKILQSCAVMEKNHPFAAVRVREILIWGRSEQYRMLRKGLSKHALGGDRCPQCNSIVDSSWAFCRNCGRSLSQKNRKTRRK